MKVLAAKTKKYWRVFLLLQHVGLMNRMAYRINFFIAFFAVLSNMVFTIIFLRVIFGFVNNFSGWGYYQALVVAATFMIIDGLLWVLCSYLGSISNHIKNGSFDRFLVSPIDSQFFISFWRGDSEDSVRIITGMALLFYAIGHLSLGGEVLLFGKLFLYLILLFNGFLIAYSIFLFLRTFSFWFIDVNSLSGLGNSLFNAAKYPATIFRHKITRIIIFSVLPLAFLATVPAKILTYGFDWILVASSFLVAGIFLWMSRRFWLWGIKKYTSASG